jgi:hypothetical protein
MCSQKYFEKMQKRYFILRMQRNIKNATQTILRVQVHKWLQTVRPTGATSKGWRVQRLTGKHLL